MEWIFRIFLQKTILAVCLSGIQRQKIKVLWAVKSVIIYPVRVIHVLKNY